MPEQLLRIISSPASAVVGTGILLDERWVLCPQRMFPYLIVVMSYTTFALAYLVIT